MRTTAKVKNERNNVNAIKIRSADWMGNVLSRECFQKTTLLKERQKEG
jgi:hypothetical protein